MAETEGETSTTPSLAPAAFVALPPGAIEPRGWLLGQLKLQSWGITGHLDEVWSDVGPNSGWLGGTGENWERGPYYLDGLTPLAYILKDDFLIAKARRWLEWSLSSQQTEGYFGPGAEVDWWSRIPMLKAMIQYQEASGDERVLDFLTRYFRFQHANLGSYPLSGWAAARAGDNIWCVHWLYERTGDAFLLDLAAALFERSLDWTSFFIELPCREKVSTWAHQTHVVNVAMGIKTPGLFYRQSGEERHRAAVVAGLANLKQYHGFVNGMFSGDEWLAGADPSQGTETCAVVEFMFSLETLLRALGDAALADQLERVAFNALPACQTANLWGHQYDQQPNQVLVSLAKRNWTANGDGANLFGLETNYGCCTANLHQGWPKFAASLWATTAQGGLAALAYAPCAVTAKMGAGPVVRIVEETDYPFAGEIRFRFGGEGPARFPLMLRVPGWCEEATFRYGDEVALKLSGGQFHSVTRLWLPGREAVLNVPIRTRLSRWYRNSLGVERGPLAFALQVGEAWSKIEGSEPSPYWEVYPTTPWNYGLLVDEEAPDTSFGVETLSAGFQPFDNVNAPVRLRARARRLPEWQMEQNSAGPLPESPARSTQPLEEVVLVPYGCARLRVAEMPQVSE